MGCGGSGGGLAILERFRGVCGNGAPRVATGFRGSPALPQQPESQPKPQSKHRVLPSDLPQPSSVMTPDSGDAHINATLLPPVLSDSPPSFHINFPAHSPCLPPYHTPWTPQAH